MWKTAEVECEEVKFNQLKPEDKVYYTLKPSTGIDSRDYLHGPFTVGFTKGKLSLINSRGVEIPISYFSGQVDWYIIKK